MPHFCYEVRDPQGKLVRGNAVAPSHRDLSLELRKVGYEILGIWQKPPYLPGSSIWRPFFRVPLSELALFTRELGMFFQAGIGLEKALDSIAEQGFSKRTSDAAKDVQKGLQDGRSLSQAMSLRSDVFRPVYTKMVRAGEESGALERVLHRLSDYLERELVLRRRLTAALVYPGFIFIICVALSSFLVFYLFPIFVSFFDGMNIELPVVTKSLMAFSRVVTRPTTLSFVFILMVSAVKLGGLLLSDHSTRAGLHRRILDWPLVGRLQKAVSLSRFASSLAILLEAGVAQYSALQLAGSAIANPGYEQAIQSAADGIRDRGDSFAEALANEKAFFPSFFVSMVAVGEELGNLPQVLKLSAERYQEEVDTAVTRLVVLLEPVMLMVMGLLVGYVLLAVFLPVYSLLDGL